MAESIHVAASEGDMNEVKRLIGGDAALLETRMTNSFYLNLRQPTPLITALALGHTQVVTWLIDQGANVEAVDGDGRKALWHASYRGNVDMVTLLMERGGANIVGRSDPQSRTALMVASEGGHTDVVSYLIDREADHPI